MKDILRPAVVILSVLATIFFNFLANALPLNGLNTGQISDRFQVYFVPAGYVFSIWGLIYLGLIAYAIYQALPAQRQNPRLRDTAYLIAGSGLANIAWLFFWHYEQFPLTLLAMLILLALLIATYLRLGIGRVSVAAGEKWSVQVPFSIYLGWITVATVANVTDVLDYLRWDGFGLADEVWMLIILAAVFVIASLVSLTRRDIAYILVILWALVGIAVKHSAVALVSSASLATAALLVIVLLYSLFAKPRLAAS